MRRVRRRVGGQAAAMAEQPMMMDEDDSQEEDDEEIASDHGDEEDEDEDEDIEPAAVGGGAQQQGNDDRDGENESQRVVNRVLRKGLESMPGFSWEIMGDKIQPLPAVFQTGLSGYWSQWTKDHGPFTEGYEPRPARVLCVTVPLEFIAKDAARIGEWETLADPLARARQVATSAILGMLTTGTAKGWVCTDKHTELIDAKRDAKDDEEEDDAKIKKRFNGNIKTYTYRPFFESRDARKKEITAMQFGWYLEELYSPDKKKIVAIRIFKMIYCKSHSDDLLWKNLMEETSDITRAGNINAIPEALRKPRMMQQNKMQRTQINDEDLENTASTQWKRISGLSELVQHYQSYAGASDGHRGRPLYAHIHRDTAAGCDTRPLREDRKWGGQHPLGPSVALNFKRYLEPDTVRPGHPGVNVSIAGAVDASGHPIPILGCQASPIEYFDPDGTFCPPDEVVELGAMWACHDNSVKNIFNIPFPRPVHGSVTPEDCLLRTFFDLRKDSDPQISKTQKGPNPKPFERIKDVVEQAFSNMEMERDAQAAAVSKSILNSEMLSHDCLDKTVAEQERLDRRAYDQKQVKQVGQVWVLEPRQCLRDVSLQQERVHAMIDDSDAQARVHLKRKKLEGDAFVAASDARQTKHNEAVEACVRLGLRRFEHAFSSKKLSATIPPGYRDICHEGLKAALKECAEWGVKMAADQGRGCRVDPEDVNAKAGTANVAFAHDVKFTAADLSGWGQWRCFLTHMLSAGIKIQGNDVRLMLEAWTHAVRCLPPPTKMVGTLAECSGFCARSSSPSRRSRSST